MRIDARPVSAVAGGIGMVVAVMWAAPSALAQPDVPVPPPPAPVEAAAGDVAPPPPPPPFDPLAFLRPAPAPPPPAAEPPPAPAPLPTPPDGVSHLASPDALPPGSTMDPAAKGTDSPNVAYLKDLWHAVQNQEISGGEALLLGLAQRGLDTPYPEQAPGPNVPVAPVDPAAAPPPPPGDAPAPPPPPADAPPPAPAPAPLMPWLP